MKNGLSMHGKGMQVFCFFAVVSLLVLSCGCTQAPVGSTAQVDETPAVTVTQPDSSHIVLTYPGSTRTDKLVELQISITDSTGRVTTQSMGSRQATTPIPYGSSHPITGSFDGKDRVLVTGYFSDGSQKTMIDTTL
jgi:hypothetical protein